MGVVQNALLLAGDGSDIAVVGTAQNTLPWWGWYRTHCYLVVTTQIYCFGGDSIEHTTLGASGGGGYRTHYYLVVTVRIYILPWWEQHRTRNPGGVVQNTLLLGGDSSDIYCFGGNSTEHTTLVGVVQNTLLLGGDSSNTMPW